MKTASIILVVALLCGCQAGAISGMSHGKTLMRTELTFGAGRADGANVSDWAWQSFVDHDVTPRFPDGLSVVPVDGQWKGKTGAIVHERAWMLIIMHTPSADADKNIEELRSIYKQRFNQESVMRADIPETVSF